MYSRFIDCVSQPLPEGDSFESGPLDQTDMATSNDENDIDEETMLVF
jgi:hypothetical protein